MILYLTPLERALDRLKEGWARHLAQPDDEQLRDGLIQRFELTYELSHKTLKRFLEANSASPDEYDRMGFPDMIRSANEAGLLKSPWPQWSVFRKMRNLTSYTYNEATAKQVVATIPDFIVEAEFLPVTLKRAHSVTGQIDITPEERAIVLRILNEIVPNREVRAFGSRVTGKAKPFSDLDLAIMGDEPLPLETRVQLEESFSESDLPWKVDVLDWVLVDTWLQEIISKNNISLKYMENK